MSNPSVSYVTYENHHRENHWFVALNVPVEVGRWLELKTNIVGVLQQIQVYRGNTRQSHSLFFGNISARLLLPWHLSLDMRYNGTSRLYYGNSEINPYHVVNIQLTKAFGKRKSIIIIGIDNLFNRTAGYVCRLEEYTVFSRNRTSSAGRILKIGLTYTFSKGRSSQRKSIKRDSSDSELKRFNEK